MLIKNSIWDDGFNKRRTLHWLIFRENAGANIIPENIQAILTSSCQQSITFLHCKNFLKIKLILSKIIIIYWFLGLASVTPEWTTSRFPISWTRIYSPSKSQVIQKPFYVKTYYFTNYFSVVSDPTYRVIATDYVTFAIEYSCQDSSLFLRHGKINKNIFQILKKSMKSETLCMRHVL